MKLQTFLISLVAVLLAGANVSAQQNNDRFKEWDKNQDGKLTKDELPDQARNRFARLDADGDGAVTREEMDAILKRRSGDRPDSERRNEASRQVERQASERPALNQIQRQRFAGLVKTVGQVPTSGEHDAWDDPELTRRVSREAVDHRKRMLIDSAATEFKPSGGPKHSNPLILCRLHLDPTDSKALAYLPVGIRDRRKGDFFGKSSLSRIWCQHGSLLSPKVKADLRAEVTSYGDFFGGGTENHMAMQRSAGYLFGEQFPDAIFYGGKTGKQVAEECGDYMRNYGQVIYARSMCEYLSTTYHGVNTAAWLNVAEFAQDDTTRLMARAILDWMFADLALNYNHGIITPPLLRANGYLADQYQLAYPRTQTAWTAWLYFGGGLIPGIDAGTDAAFSDPKYKPLQPYGMAGVLHAVSPYVPHEAIRNLGAKRVKTPFMAWQSRINETRALKSAAGSGNQPGPHLRSTYTNENYAIGTGHFDEDVSLSLALTFAVSYKSNDEHNYLMAKHPYWFTDAIKGQKPKRERGPGRGQGTSRPRFDVDEDWMGVSPFCQSVHWENAVVQLYDIPAKDPYTDADWKTGGHMPSARLPNPIQSVFVYVPETIDERLQVGNDFFFREREGESEVYIAVRPLRAGATWTPTVKKGYVRLELPAVANLTGFAMEVGDRAEFGSFKHFQKSVTASVLDTSELDSNKEVTYTSTRGNTLYLQHQPVPNTSSTWLPNASINGTTLDFDAWPISQSPYVKCSNRVLDVNDGHSGFTIDWSGDLPVYTYYDLDKGVPVITREEFIQRDKLVITQRD